MSNYHEIGFQIDNSTDAMSNSKDFEVVKFENPDYSPVEKVLKEQVCENVRNLTTNDPNDVETPGEIFYDEEPLGIFKL